MPIDLVKKHLNWFLATLNDFLSALNEMDIWNFASVHNKILAELLEKLERNSEWNSHPLIEDNYINLNSGKCHLLISGHKYEHQWAQVSKDMVWVENKVKFLGITIDNELIFDGHILES